MAAGMRKRLAELAEPLTGTIYDAAMDARHWPAVLLQLKQCFRTEAETFYILDFTTRRVRQAHLAGVTPQWLACFDEHYFSPDNPWIVHSLSLHRPGRARTNERLDAHARGSGLLYRSQYYNEWMRPQGLHYSIGNTLTTERSGIANVTLLRAPDLPTFDAAEVALFERLSGHFARALRIRGLLGDAQLQRGMLADALDRLRDGLLLLAADGRLLHGNRVALDGLAQGRGLVYRAGRVQPAHEADRAAFGALLRAPAAAAGTPGADTLQLRSRGGGLGWRVQATPLALPLASAHGMQPCVLLALCDGAPAVPPATLLRQAYGLTPAEVRLVQALLQGGTLREAAEQLALSYETARTRLKTVFLKTGTHRQAQLLARLHQDLARPLDPLAH